jgi:ABC-type uncharacterized transport system permease subunit
MQTATYRVNLIFDVVSNIMVVILMILEEYPTPQLMQDIPVRIANMKPDWFIRYL